MLPFENMTADYIKETNNHVLYRVTPILTKTIFYAVEYLWKGTQLKIREKASVSVYMPITLNLG